MPESLATLEADLVIVRAAIVKAQEAQSYSTMGRSKTNAAIESLYKERDRLQKLIDRLSTGSTGGSVRFPLFGTRS
jgi:hypothetical protein